MSYSYTYMKVFASLLLEKEWNDWQVNQILDAIKFSIEHPDKDAFYEFDMYLIDIARDLDKDGWHVDDADELLSAFWKVSEYYKL